jgi:hypothetical protein
MVSCRITLGQDAFLAYDGHQQFKFTRGSQTAPFSQRRQGAETEAREGRGQFLWQSVMTFVHPETMKIRFASLRLCV